MDGELYNHDLRDNFNKITSLVRKQIPVQSEKMTDKAFAKKQDKWKESLEESESTIQYWIYDCPKIAQAEETVPFFLRYETLINTIQEKDCVKFVTTTEVFSQKRS